MGIGNKIKSKAHSSDYMDGVASYYASNLQDVRQVVVSGWIWKTFSAAHPTFSDGD